MIRIENVSKDLGEFKLDEFKIINKKEIPWNRCCIKNDGEQSTILQKKTRESSHTIYQHSFDLI